MDPAASWERTEYPVICDPLNCYLETLHNCYLGPEIYEFVRIGLIYIEVPGNLWPEVRPLRKLHNTSLATHTHTHKHIHTTLKYILDESFIPALPGDIGNFIARRIIQALPRF